MRKKVMMCGGICLFLAAVCLIINMGNVRENPVEEESSAALGNFAEGGSEDTEEPETAAEEAERKVQYVYFLEDEEVKENSLFHAFINKEITAYDSILEEERYVYDYYNDYYNDFYTEDPNAYYKDFANDWSIHGVHFMAEDLNSDGKEELLLLLQTSSSDVDLMVYEERDGKLYAWETWKDFKHMHMIDAYYGNGIFYRYGTNGIRYERYDSEGRVEELLAGRFEFGEEEDRQTVTFILTVYKDGIEEKELEYKKIYLTETHETYECTPEDQAVMNEVDAILEEIETSMGEQKYIDYVTDEEDAVQVLMEELASAR